MNKQALHRFFKGVSSAREDQQIVEWLEDPLNRKIFDEERRLFNTMLMLDDQLAVAKPHARKLPRWAKELMRTAAIVVLAVIGAGIYLYSHWGQRIEGYENSIYVPVGQCIEITLSDGTKVMVNGSTTIKYPAIFYAKERRIQLSGEAFFEVTGNPDHPFIVETDRCEIEALGTAFNVDAFEHNELIVVSLVKGKVKVTGNNAQATLRPNEEARLIDGKLTVGKIPEYEAFQWREGVIAFRNATFAEIMVLFEKYYGFDINYHTANLPKETLSGKIRISEGIDHALWVLQQNTTFNYHKHTDSKAITIK